MLSSLRGCGSLITHASRTHRTLVLCVCRGKLHNKKSVQKYRSLIQKRFINFGNRPDDGYALTDGSFLKVIHQRARDKLNQSILLHSSKIMVLVSCFTLDWTVLRCTLITSSLMSVAFHFLFPHPRPARMMWGIIFAVGHAYSLFLHLRETADYQLEPFESNLYESLFAEHGFTKWHFLQMMSKAEVKHFEQGEYIFEECEIEDMFPIVLEGKSYLSWRRDGEISKAYNRTLTSYALKKEDKEAWTKFPTHQSENNNLLWEIWDRNYYSPETLEKLKKAYGDEKHR